MSIKRYSSEPLVGRAYRFYRDRTPSHRGKLRLLNVLRSNLAKRVSPFYFELANGVRILIKPSELNHIGSVGFSCYERGGWENHIEEAIKAILKPGDTAFDVGGNVGCETAVMASLVGRAGRVYSFEPVPSTYGMLLGCIDLNQFANVYPQNVGLSDQAGKAKIYPNDENAGLSSLHAHDRRQSVLDIDLDTIDRFCRANNVASVSLIKIDVEGNELAVIKGAKQTIELLKPYIIFEYNPPLARRANWSLTDIATELGVPHRYSLYRLAENAAAASPLDAEAFTSLEQEMLDIIAMPNESTIGVG